MKLLLIALSLASAESGWVVLSDLHGCSFNRDSYRPGMCAGMIAVQTEGEDGPDYEMYSVPFTVAIQNERGETSTLPYEGWVEFGYQTLDTGVKQITWIRKSPRTGGPARLDKRRPGFDPAALSREQLDQWLNIGFQQDYAKAIKALLAQGRADEVRKKLSSETDMTRMMAIWAMAELLPPEMAADVEARLSDKHGYVRAEAVYFLKKTKRAECADKVAPLLKDPYTWARRFAADYIGELKITRLKPQLQAALKTEKDADVRKSLEKALAAL